MSKLCNQLCIQSFPGDIGINSALTLTGGAEAIKEKVCTTKVKGPRLLIVVSAGYPAAGLIIASSSTETSRGMESVHRSHRQGPLQWRLCVVSNQGNLAGLYRLKWAERKDSRILRLVALIGGLPRLPLPNAGGEDPELVRRPRNAMQDDANSCRA